MNKFLQQASKKSLGEVMELEAKQLARQLTDSNAPGEQTFMSRLEQLNPGATSTLRGLIDTIDLGAGFVFVVPGQQQLINFQSCGASTCGGGTTF
ncbi:MAG: hypothetical protein ABI693_30440 [Bryobacteraceae bacterium]